MNPIKLLGFAWRCTKNLDAGLRKLFYKEALELEFMNERILYERERLFRIEYKGKILKHRYNADFIVFNQIVLEVKATSVIVDNFVVQTINYLKVSGLKLGIIANFGQRSLTYKRILF